MQHPGHMIREEASGASFCCAEGETLLAAAARTGRPAIPVGCRNGGCGMCKVQVLAGQYRTGKMSRAHVSETEEMAGFVLACRTLPSSPLEIRVCRPNDGPGTAST